MTDQMISLADRLFVPANTRALLWDLDGTLVSSFRFDVIVCSKILSEHAGRALSIPEDTLGQGFALSGFDFWTFLFKAMGLAPDRPAIEAAYEEWARLRSTEAFPLNEGVVEVLEAAQRAGLKMAVVSNNPEQEVIDIVNNSGLASYFDRITGNDGSGRAKKPAPDSYLFASRQLSVDMADCTILEDSVLGLHAGAACRSAYVVGVASGVENYSILKASGLAQHCYNDLSLCFISRASGLSSDIKTPENFVKDVLTGVGAELRISLNGQWTNDNMTAFGKHLARFLTAFL